MDFAAPCLFGLEGLAANELKKMDAQKVIADNGKVYFSGDYDIMARTNINSRFAERVLIIVGRFGAYSFDELFEKTRALPWENWITRKDRFPVKGWSINSKLHSIPDCQKIIKKAVVERLKSKYRISWFEETGSLYSIQFSIMKDEVALMIDTSGEGLHKRGYRPASNDAPIRETLAAAMAYIAHVRGSSTVVDPMCGSGTLLIESALHAMRIAPGMNRNFISEGWNIPKETWLHERQRAIDRIVRNNDFIAHGHDIDPRCEALVKNNAKRAGVDTRIDFSIRNIKDHVSEEGSIVLCNPPYGERLLNIKEARDIYGIMGKAFDFSKESCYIISPDEEFEKLFGRKASKRRKLYNGMIKCQLYMYF
ncbi:MAG: class I SAM-dependent RNA methyltransferase [Clostridia bacterium]|nr:class I SAM-dependent RNA methyltransferase [Clostridia bacterium]